MSHLLPLSALIILACCQLSLGQEARSQPVARLITSIAPITKIASTPATLEPNDIEKRAFEETNLMRKQNGLPPLTWDGDVCRMARIHSESMSRQGYFSH